MLKTISFFSTISEEAKQLINKIKVTDEWLKTAQLICTKTDGKKNMTLVNLDFL